MDERNREMKPVLQSGKLTFRQCEIISLLMKQEEWSIIEIAQALGISAAAATKAVSCLEEKGLIERQANLRDRRSVSIRVSRNSGWR
jgi:DNA-binding MarR family transcriptional regulator